MPRVSIITPTFNRHALLPALWACISAQTVQDFEWLVHDDSQQCATMFDSINDKRISYMHVPGRMTIGAKRNALCAAAKSEIIMHFDDDDFYAPRYIEEMLSFMTDRGVDFVKLFGFFVYHRMHRQLGYWSLETDFPLHYMMQNPVALVPSRRAPGAGPNRWGFGFSYVFHRRVWEAVRFPDDKIHGEDKVFAANAVLGFRSAGRQDSACTCLHIIHAANTSIAFPQQILPTRLLRSLFPDFRS